MVRCIYLCLMLGLLSVPEVVAEDSPSNKLVRGVINIVSAPFEIPKQARAYWIEGAYKTDHILIWTASGAVWGMVQGVKRSGSGVWDVISFPFDLPAGYQPLIKPDYVFEEWPSDPEVFIFKRRDKWIKD